MNPTPITEKIEKVLRDYEVGQHADMWFKEVSAKIASVIEKPEPISDSGSSKPRLSNESIAQKPAEPNPTKGWTPEVDEAARKAEKIFAPKEESSMGWEERFDKRFCMENGVLLEVGAFQLKSFFRAELKAHGEKIVEFMLKQWPRNPAKPAEKCDQELELEKGLYAHCLLPKGHAGIHDPNTPFPKEESSMGWRERFKKEFIDENPWQGEDEYTKNVAVGNVENFIERELARQRESLLKNCRNHTP